MTVYTATDSGVTNGRRAHTFWADLCWCRPDDRGDVIVHRQVHLRPDERPRMAVYTDD